jgi:hypothetical protein
VSQDLKSSGVRLTVVRQNIENMGHVLKALETIIFRPEIRTVRARHTGVPKSVES